MIAPVASFVELSGVGDGDGRVSGAAPRAAHPHSRITVSLNISVRFDMRSSRQFQKFDSTNGLGGCGTEEFLPRPLRFICPKTCTHPFYIRRPLAQPNAGRWCMLHPRQNPPITVKY